MHFSSNSVWTAALLVPSATAFFPGHPSWEHSNGDSSTVQRRAPFFPVHAQWDHGHSDQPPSPREATTKRGKSVTFPLRRVAVPVRRDYDYNIVDSKDPKQKNSVAVDQDGKDLSYMAAVSFGDSKKEHHMLLDSAATHTWVYGNDCKDKACEEHVQFGKGDSSTLKLIDANWQVGYATGDNLNLTTASDKIHVGSASVDLTFGLVTDATDGMFNFAMDGILGLGRGDNLEMATKAPGFVEVLKTSGVISSKLYGIHYSRASDGLNDGELNFGELNKDRYDGDINYLSTENASAGLWEVSLDDAGVDGKAIGFESKLAVMDTGTSWIWVPPTDAKAFHDLIPGAKGSGTDSISYTVPCSSKQVLWLQLNGQKYNISQADWMGPDENNDGLCDSRILGRQYNPNNPNSWLVGDTFLKNVYSVYDFDNNQFGLGAKAAEEKPEPSSTPTSSGTSASPTAISKSSSSTSAPTSATPSETGSSTKTPSNSTSNLSAQPTGGSGTGGTPGPAGTPGEASGTPAGVSPSFSPSSSPSPPPAGAAGHMSVSVATLSLSVIFGCLFLFI